MDTMFNILAFLPAMAVIVSVAKQSKSIASIVQMGSIMSRTETQCDGVPSQANEAMTKSLKEAQALIMDKDKIVFTLSAFNIGFTCFLFGRYPDLFYLWHLPKVILLVAIRWYIFHGEGKHYLLYDFCYWANLLSMFYTLVIPDSGVCFQVLYLAANGPLAWSILAFSQSLVLHSLQHMTSVFIHTSPMLLTLGLRWSTSTQKRFHTRTPELGESTFQLVTRGVLYLYLPWVLLYYFWVFVVLADRIKSRGYQTLFDRVTGMSIGKNLEKFSDKTDHQFIRKAVYLLSHLAFGTATMVFAALMYHNEAAHFVFALSVLSASAWNGAGFYGKVWATKYTSQVQEAAQNAVKTGSKSSIQKSE